MSALNVSARSNTQDGIKLLCLLLLFPHHPRQGQDKLQREREKDSSRFLTSFRVRNKKTAESSGLKMKKKTSDNRPPVSKKTLLVSNEVGSSESGK